MSYKTNSDLPLEVRNHMPTEAQTIFRDAFNNALKEYGDKTRAFKVAWSAVEREYVKGNKGHWNKKDTINKKEHELIVPKELPHEAQNIFRTVFDKALKEYGTKEQAFKVAWAAVEYKYEKNDKGEWEEKE